MLTREQILTADDLAKELVACPEWGGEVYVRTMTGEERDRFEAVMIQDPEAEPSKRYEHFRARLVVLTICDEKGMPVFFLNDVAALSQKSAKALDRVFSVAQRLSGMTKEDVEALTKNSPTPGAASGSDSP